jgi:hypothetical protein
MNLVVTLSEVAEAEVENAHQWLSTRDFSLAERWLFLLQMELQSEAERVQNGLRRTLSPESEDLRRDVYAFIFRTGGNKASSAWRVWYELLDSDHDGVIDQFYVVRVRHASAN